jgi:hypothetical protein
MSKKSGRRKGTRKQSAVADMPARKGQQAKGGSLPIRTDRRQEVGVTLENVQITSYQLGVMSRLD